jgi:hypothetical protein
MQQIGWRLIARKAAAQQAQIDALPVEQGEE